MKVGMTDGHSQGRCVRTSCSSAASVDETPPRYGCGAVRTIDVRNGSKSGTGPADEEEEEAATFCTGLGRSSAGICRRSIASCSSCIVSIMNCADADECRLVASLLVLTAAGSNPMLCMSSNEPVAGFTLS